MLLEKPAHMRENIMVPGTKNNYDNPDTIYRNFYIISRKEYLIKGY